MRAMTHITEAQMLPGTVAEQVCREILAAWRLGKTDSKALGQSKGLGHYLRVPMQAHTGLRQAGAKYSPQLGFWGASWARLSRLAESSASTGSGSRRWQRGQADCGTAMEHEVWGFE